MKNNCIFLFRYGEFVAEFPLLLSLVFIIIYLMLAQPITINEPFRRKWSFIANAFVLFIYCPHEIRLVTFSVGKI